MIFKLLQTVASLLQSELRDHISNAESAIQVLPTKRVENIVAPAIAIAPDYGALSQHNQTVGKHALTVREFQQKFKIVITNEALPVVEEQASLVTGILLHSHDDLIRQFNAIAPLEEADPEITTQPTQYRSQNFITTHTLNSFKLLDATYLSAQTDKGEQVDSEVIRLQLNWQALGQIQVERIRREGDRLIERVVISSSTSVANL